MAEMETEAYDKARRSSASQSEEGRTANTDTEEQTVTSQEQPSFIRVDGSTGMGTSSEGNEGTADRPTDSGGENQ